MAVKALPLIAESGHQDANQNFSIVGVQGTLGTSDVVGTAPTVAFSGDPATGAQYVYNLGPAGSVSLGNTPGGTINRIGSIDTIGTMPAISLALNTGTITTIAAGTQNTLGTVGTTLGIGTVSNLGSFTNGGTIKEITNIAGGSVQITDATNTANTLNGSSGTAAGQNALLVGGAYREVTFTTTSVQAVAATDVSNYKWISVHITGQGTSSTVTFQGSNDNTNWVSVNLIISTAANNTSVNTSTTTGIWHGPLAFRYFRLNVTGISGGTTAGVIELYTNPTIHTGIVTTVLQNGAWNVTGTIATGTIQNINAGTIQQNFIPTVGQSTFGTHGTTGATIFGTLAGGAGAGAGTEIFITSLSMSIPSTGGSQDVSIGWGTNGGTFHAGTGLLVRGNFPAGGGIQKEFNPAINSGTNGQLTVFQAGAGTVDVNVTYFTVASVI